MIISMYLFILNILKIVEVNWINTITYEII